MEPTWEDALDALEEWVRRTATTLRHSEPGVPDPAPQLPQGLVPDDLRLRAQLLASALRNVESDVLRRREQLERERTYGAA
jgi:hypothetical protein